MRISDWSSDVCSSDLAYRPEQGQMNRIMNVPSFRPLRARLLISGLFLALAAPAMGQAVSVLKGPDRKKPVDVDADRVEVQDRQDRAVFSGNVKVRQGKLATGAARPRVAYRNATGPAEGNGA